MSKPKTPPKAPSHDLVASPRASSDKPFPIVGIGASAGGLEALEQFLGQVPVHSGLAFVIVQHLDPNHKGLLPELLQKITAMEIRQIKDRMPVQPDCVYVIPPNKDLCILHGTLSLFEPESPRGLRLPIDFFLRTLAKDQHSQAIGVILSGMGSDGTLGLRAVKENGGLTLVQDPSTAKYDAMPRSAIATGLADIVAPAAELPGKLIDILQHITVLDSSVPAVDAPALPGTLDRIILLLRERMGHDFSLYKKNTLYRRIERRMSLHQLDKMDDYVRYLRENRQELDLLFKELLIGVTHFFRDPDDWQILREQALPSLLQDAPNDRTLRAWVVGCSTGEEAYSLAMVLQEILQQRNARRRITLQIFATDLDPDAIEQARQGFYPANIAADVAPERLHRFFIEENNGYRVGKAIRERVVFAPQNVIMNPPFTRLDILTCRNLLIYLEPRLQKSLLKLFYYSLNPNGLLFLGSAETIAGYTDLFTPVDGKARIYRRNDGPAVTVDLDFSGRRQPDSPRTTASESPESSPIVNLQALANQVLLQGFAPPAVLVNGQGDILYIHGRTGMYLEPAAGKANWNLYVMAREGLRQELEFALHKALRQLETVYHPGIRVATNGSTQTVDLTVQGLKEPPALRGMALVVLAGRPTPVVEAEPAPSTRRRPSSSREMELTQALRQARQENQNIREEMQRSQEELRSAHEESQSTNEELQSTNEELLTSKEEMQSLNEELQTLNAELQAKVDELSLASSDMKNLLNSTDIAIVFLDSNLRVRRFTNQATKLFKLIPADAGRPLTDIVSNLKYPALAANCHEVLDTLVLSDKEIHTQDGQWFQVRIIPYRTLDDRIDGLVITFTDISAAKRLEAQLRHHLVLVPAPNPDEPQP